MLITFIMFTELVNAFESDKLRLKKLIKCEDKVDEKDFSND